MKSYALSDEDTIEGYSTILSSNNENETITGYIELFRANGISEFFRNGNGISEFFSDKRLLQNAKKFVIGLWLGTTSITLALILHVGRCSVKVANSVNTIILELTELINKFISLPSTVVGLVKDVTQKGKQGTKEEEKKSNKNDIEGVDKGSVRKDSARDQSQFESDDIELITHEKTEYPNTSDEEGKNGDVDKGKNKDGEKYSVRKMLPKHSSRDQCQIKSDDIELVTFEKTEHPSTIDEQVSEVLGSDEKTETQIPSITPESHKKTEHSEAKVAIDENVLEELSVLEKQISKPALSTDPLHTSDRMMNKFTLNGNGHPFEFFTKSLQKIFTSSIILLLGFLGYDIYIYVTHARKQSYDWFILFPFPFWFSLVAIINCFAFIITESVFCCTIKRGNNAPHSCTRIVCKYFTDFVITISATTFPVFIFFHLFWLIIASSAFAIRIVTSITFYIPLAIFIIWFLSVTSSMLETWKKLLTKKTARRSKCCTCKRVLHNIHLFLRPLIPFLFLPFWTLLLGTLHFFSDFLLNVVDLENQSLLILLGLIIVIVGTTLKLAKSCRPKLDVDETENEG